MKRSVHAIMGAVIGLIIAWNNMYVLFPSIIFGWFGGYFPDIDLKLRHRKSLHNIISITTVAVLIYIGSHMFFEKVGSLDISLVRLYSMHMTLSFFIAAIAHVFIDAFTPRGVFILWPISKKRLRFARIKSNNRVYNGVGIAVSLILFILWLTYTTGIISLLR